MVVQRVKFQNVPVKIYKPKIHWPRRHPKIKNAILEIQNFLEWSASTLHQLCIKSLQQVDAVMNCTCCCRVNAELQKHMLMQLQIVQIVAESMQTQEILTIFGNNTEVQQWFLQLMQKVDSVDSQS